MKTEKMRKEALRALPAGPSPPEREARTGAIFETEAQRAQRMKGCQGFARTTVNPTSEVRSRGSDAHFFRTLSVLSVSLW